MLLPLSSSGQEKQRRLRRVCSVLLSWAVRTRTGLLILKMCSKRVLRKRTNVVLMVNDGVVICLAAGVSVDWLYVISPVVRVDGSLKFTL